MRHLTALQVASLRIISSGLILLPLVVKSYQQIPRNKIFIVFMSGVLGSLIPAYLFCIAEQGVDSALAGALNSLTPIFVIIAGALFFRTKTSFNKILGIVVAFSGSILLFLSQPDFSANSNSFYVTLIVSATIMYGINVNMVHRHLHHIPSIRIASLALSLNMISALVVLFFTGFFNLDFHNRGILISTCYSCILGVCGTTIATVLFYILIKRSGAVFSSMVTYAIPIIAIMWGVIYGEKIGWQQVASLLLILAGVWIANLAVPEKTKTTISSAN